MYLRYGDPSWDLEQTSDAPPPGDGQGSGRAPRRQDPTAQPLNGHRFPVVELHGVGLHAITEATCIRHILDELDAGRGGMVVTPNLDHLRRCAHDVNFSALVAEADLVVADGMPLVWASRLQGTPLPERVAGSNMISTLSAAAGARGRSIFLLGGSPGTAEGAARVLRDRYLAVKVAGTFFPPIGFEDDAKLMGELVQNLSAAAPDIVYVALGSPKQERLIARLRRILPDAWWLGVGNSFSFLCGDVRRAPRWMQKCGLEWVHRLCQEPRRLFHRYVIVGVPFAASLLGRSAMNGIPNRLPFNRARRQQAADGIQRVEAQTIAAANRAADLPAAAQDPVAQSIFSIPLQTESASRPPAEPVRIVELRRETTSAFSAVPTTSPLSRLRALVLLGGSVRPSALCIASNRSPLDLPLDESGSVLNHWLNQAAEVARAAGIDRLPVRVMVNQTSPEPASAHPQYYGSFRVERDLSEFRGTGGVLHDIASDYADDDWVLVANAAQVLVDPLASVVAALQHKGGDVSVISHSDGTPSGVMLVNCKTLRVIPDEGYVDMKEQALPLIAQQFDVRVVERRRPTGLPIRSLEDYIQGLRYHHRRRMGKPAATDPLAEDWNPAFALVEPGAVVDPSVRLHDSVVLRGGVVEAGAVLVRSVVCAGGIVRRDKSAVDAFVNAESNAATNGAAKAARTTSRTRSKGRLFSGSSDAIAAASSSSAASVGAGREVRP